MPEPTSTEDASARKKIIRDVLIFQAKLWLEGFKDIVLMPLSLGAALIDLVFRRTGNRDTLYAVMRMGDRFERWVHLYAALEKTEGMERKDGVQGDSLDDLLNDAADGIEHKATNGRTYRTDANRSQS